MKRLLVGLLVFVLAFALGSVLPAAHLICAVCMGLVAVYLGVVALTQR